MVVKHALWSRVKKKTDKKWERKGKERKGKKGKEAEKDEKKRKVRKFDCVS